MALLPVDFLRTIFLAHSAPELAPFRALQASGTDDEGPFTDLDRYVGGIYRGAPDTPRDPGDEIAVFSDAKRPLADRLKAIETAERVVRGLDENSHAFFDGVMALFKTAIRPQGDRNASYQVRVKAATALGSALTRLPASEDRRRVFAHAYLCFTAAVWNDLTSKRGTCQELKYAVTMLSHRIRGTKESCAPSVEACLDDVINVVENCQWYDAEGRFKPPWTLKKGFRNAKIGLLGGGYFGLGFSFWAWVLSFVSTPLSLALYGVGATVTVGTTAVTFFYKAPQRFRHKLLAMVLRNDRPTARQLEEKRVRLLKSPDES